MTAGDLAGVVAETLGLDDSFLLEGEEPTQETLEALLMSPPTLEEAERLLRATPPQGGKVDPPSTGTAPVMKVGLKLFPPKTNIFGKGKGKGKQLRNAPPGLRTIKEDQVPSPTATTAPASPLTPCLDIETSYFDEDIKSIPIDTITINSPEHNRPVDPRVKPFKNKGSRKFPQKLKGYRHPNARFTMSDPYPEVRLIRPRFNHLYDTMSPDESGQNQIEVVTVFYRFTGDPFPEHREVVSYRLPRPTNKAHVIARITPRASILRTEATAQYVRRVKSQDNFLGFLQEANKVLDLNALVFDFKYPVACSRNVATPSLTQAEAMAHPKGVPTCVRNRDPPGRPTMFVEATIAGPKLKAQAHFNQVVENCHAVRDILDRVLNHRRLVSDYFTGLSSWTKA